jgi:regulator of sigma E protease
MSLHLSSADLLTGVLAVVALGILIIVHEGGHYFLARWSGMRVDRFSIGLGPKVFGFRRGETEFQISAIPFGGFVQIAGLNPGEEGIALDDPRAYPNRPAYQRLLTIFAGPATNYLFAAVVMMASFLMWGVPEIGKQPLVGALVDGKPAAAAGLQPGDEIQAVDGHAITDSGDVPKYISGTQGREFAIDVLRNGAPMSFHLKAERDGSEYRVGVQLEPKEVRVHKGAAEAIKQGVIFPVQYTAFIIHGFSEIFAGRQKAQFSGPLGILKVMKNQIKRGATYAFDIAAIISVYLGFFNLLPLPALDGSRMVFLGWELLSRRRVNQRIEQNIHMAGMLVLIGFILIVTIAKDVPDYLREFLHR